jgi:hypothetical protein
LVDRARQAPEPAQVQTSPNECAKDDSEDRRLIEFIGSIKGKRHALRHTVSQVTVALQVVCELLPLVIGYVVYATHECAHFREQKRIRRATPKTRHFH